MGLAAAIISPPEFHQIQGHLAAHKPPYRTMHLREIRQRNRQRVLRYLHAMHTPLASPNTVEGMISGPGVFWHYQLVASRTRTQLNVLFEQGPADDLARIGDRFLPEILNRIAEEQAAAHPYPRYLAGQFYLRRKRGGVAATHPACRQALTQGVLDRRFVGRLSAWDLELLCP